MTRHLITVLTKTHHFQGGPGIQTFTHLAVYPDVTDHPNNKQTIQLVSKRNTFQQQERHRETQSCNTER